jgi:hypothetical protein
MTKLNLLAEYGVCLVDDMLPQLDWTEEHALKMAKLFIDLSSIEALASIVLHVSTRLMMCTKLPGN